MQTQRHDGAALTGGTSCSGVCAVGTRQHRHLRPTSLTRPHAHSTRLTPSGFAGARPAAPSSAAQSSSIDGSSAEPSGTTFSPSSVSAESDDSAISEVASTDVVSGSTDAAWGAGVAGAETSTAGKPLWSAAAILRLARIRKGSCYAEEHRRDTWGHLETPDSQCAACTCVPAEVTGWAHLLFAA